MPAHPAWLARFAARRNLPPFAAASSLALVLIGGCSAPTKQHSGPAAGTAPTTIAQADDPYPGVNSVGKDRDVWMQLLARHGSIRRSLTHRQEGDLGIVEAVTESDDPEVVALIQDHARAMQARMKVGAQVRSWDPVFTELFARYQLVTLEVTPTEHGVRIVEWSRDPETIALLRSHAMGVNDFVCEGMKANGRETARLPVGAPLPASEQVVGGASRRTSVEPLRAGSSKEGLPARN